MGQSDARQMVWAIETDGDSENNADLSGYYVPMTGRVCTDSTYVLYSVRSSSDRC